LIIGGQEAKLGTQNFEFRVSKGISYTNGNWKFCSTHQRTNLAEFLFSKSRFKIKLHSQAFEFRILGSWGPKQNYILRNLKFELLEVSSILRMETESHLRTTFVK
jgi:hypothetical protein